jgi:hypothetical protein
LGEGDVRVKTLDASDVVGAEKAHAVYGASSSDRWLGCPGSTNLIGTLPAHARKDESPFAAEGTKAHECLEFMLKNRKNISAATIQARKKYPEEMIIHAEMAIREVEKRLKERPDSELMIEVKADLPVSEPGQFGTGDIVLAEYFGLLEVIDYKYGAGVVVDPEENTQLLYYALGIAHKLDYNFSAVRLTIIQPRAQVDGKFVRSWDTTVENLIEWRAKFEAGIKAAKKKDAPLSSGDHCRWCTAAVICPEIKNRALKQAQVDFDDRPGREGGLTLPVVSQANSTALTPARVAKMLDAFPLLERWMESVREYAFKAANHGQRFPGYKLVQKRSTRKWIAPEKTADVARQEFGKKAFTTPELLSPAQLEKIAGKDWVEVRVTSESSGLTLVPESHKSPAVNPAALDFDDKVSKPQDAAKKSGGSGEAVRKTKKISKR